MGWVRSGARSGVVLLLALFLAGPAPRAAAQTTAARSRPQKSVYGKLERVDKNQNRLLMKSDAGQSIAWQLDAAAIAEVARFNRGDPMIVIYRQITPNEKRVTAVAFPGTATTPLYVNMTGSRVLMRSAPFVDGVCGNPNAGPVTETEVPSGGMAEVSEACWCCAPAGESCNPGNKSGLGRAFLLHCFE